MNDEGLRSAYAQFLSTRRVQRAECVSPDALLAVVDGSASEAERIATLRHVGLCRACQSDLGLLTSAGEAAGSVTAVPGWRRWPALAAAAIVLVVAGSFAIREATLGTPADVLRDAAPTPVRLLAPAESVAATTPVNLVWSALPDTRRYEIEILRPTGEVVYATTAVDTVLVVPASVLTPGADYRWWVVAVLPEGKRTSALRRLRVTAP